MDGKESNVPAPKKNNVNAPEQEHTKKKQAKKSKSESKNEMEKAAGKNVRYSLICYSTEFNATDEH